MTTLQVVLDWLHDKTGPRSGICTRDYDIVDARDSAVPIMDDTPNAVGLVINLFYHPLYYK